MQNPVLQRGRCPETTLRYTEIFRFRDTSTQDFGNLSTGSGWCLKLIHERVSQNQGDFVKWGNSPNHEFDEDVYFHPKGIIKF
jgi:hypothetical protein